MLDTPAQEEANKPISAGPLFDGAAYAIRLISGLSLLLLVLLICVEIISRFFFNYSLRVVEELAGYLVVCLTLMGASLSLRQNQLFQVEFIFNQWPELWKRYLNLFYLMLSLSVCGVLIFYTSHLVLSSFGRGNVAPTFLMTPLWIPQVLIPLGLSCIAIFIVEKIILLLCNRGRK